MTVAYEAATLSFESHLALLDNLGGVDRNVDALLAKAFGTYQHLADGLSDNEYACEVANVTYRPEYDNALVTIRAKGTTTGGVCYPAEVPAFTKSYDAAKTLMPKGETWTMAYLVRDGSHKYIVTIRGGSFEGASDALAVCRAAVWFVWWKSTRERRA